VVGAMPELLYKDLSFELVGAAFEVHRGLGPGYLEAVYHKALEYELTMRGLTYESRKCLRVVYKGLLVGEYETDLSVDDKVVLELKAVSAINAAHIAQVHHYLTGTGYRLGIILNFGAESLGMKRVVK
jgi:GxxExxY protein